MKALSIFLVLLVSQNIFAENLTSADLELPGLADGKILNIRFNEFDFIVLDFWASWCGPCQDSLPFYEEQNELWKKKRVLFIGVNVDSDKQEALDFLKKQPIKYPVIIDTNRKLSGKLNVNAIPRTFIFDKQLHLVKLLKGYTSEKKEEIRTEFKQIFLQGVKK